ncbi:MAG: glycogen synthase GlgA [Eubacteriales bacterium]
MKILYVASEVAPFIKTGGLADVAGALPQVLAQQGHDIRVVLPLYHKIGQEFRKEMAFATRFYVHLAWREQYCGIMELERDGVVYYFVDNEYYFKRTGVYGYDDDSERFAFFSKAVLDMLPQVGFCPDVINANDWQAALIPTYHKLYYKVSDFYQNIKTVLTIHNIGYQGQFGRHLMEDTLGINNFFFDCGFMELDGDVNYMKAGVLAADAVTTVSNTYAQEIMTDYYGHGLQYILQENAAKVHGVINGLDVDLYNPESNPALFEHYDVDTLEIKAKNKAKLMEMLSLDCDDDTPVIGIISRFVSHKGFDLIAAVLEDILRMDVRLVVVGTGDSHYEEMFRTVKARHPEKVSVNIAFSEDLANKVYAGADLFLMPSISEPCGLAQMIAMRYGTLPIVRETGGLADTVEAYRADVETGDGFSFHDINAHDMLHVIEQACHLFKTDRKAFTAIMKRAMVKDFTWDSSAKKYVEIYENC